MTAPAASAPAERRALGVACGAHALHDGYTDLIYVMLPIWQHEFGLGFAALGLMKTVFSGTLAGLSDSVGLAGRTVRRADRARARHRACRLRLLPRRLQQRRRPAGGRAVRGRARRQHAASVGVIADRAGLRRARSLKALGTYNFAGDIGKMTLPAAASLLFVVLPWREALVLLGGIGGWRRSSSSC